MKKIQNRPRSGGRGSRRASWGKNWAGRWLARRPALAILSQRPSRGFSPSEVVCQGFFEKKSTRCPQFFSQPSHLLPGRLGRKLLDGRPQGRVATLQRFQVLLFVIGNPVLPTTKQDTDPFVSHHPNGGPVAVAAGS